MGRKRFHTPLRVLLNNRLVGCLVKDPGGAIDFRYDESWLAWEHALPVSLSLPLREDAYRGEPVAAVFENLLPDSENLRRRVAEKVGASGTDSYSLLSQIGRDCVGALQFLPEGEEAISDTAAIAGEVISDDAIEALLKNLAQAPLGLHRDQEFRISVAGAQEKTALLFHEGKWWKPHGTTPTTHLFKTQMGTLPNGIDLSNSIENEYYCLKLLAAFGLPVNAAEIRGVDRRRPRPHDPLQRRTVPRSISRCNAQTLIFPLLPRCAPRNYRCLDSCNSQQTEDFRSFPPHLCPRSLNKPKPTAPNPSPSPPCTNPCSPHS